MQKEKASQRNEFKSYVDNLFKFMYICSHFPSQNILIGELFMTNILPKLRTSRWHNNFLPIAFAIYIPVGLFFLFFLCPCFVYLILLVLLDNNHNVEKMCERDILNVVPLT